MPLLRLLLAGLVALAAMVAVLFTAAVVLFTGMAGFVAQLFRGKPPSPRPARHPDPAPRGPAEDVIDVEATRVPDDPPRT